MKNQELSEAIVLGIIDSDRILGINKVFLLLSGYGQSALLCPYCERSQLNYGCEIFLLQSWGDFTDRAIAFGGTFSDSKKEWITIES